MPLLYGGLPSYQSQLRPSSLELGVSYILLPHSVALVVRACCLVFCWVYRGSQRLLIKASSDREQCREKTQRCRLRSHLGRKNPVAQRRDSRGRSKGLNVRYTTLPYLPGGSMVGMGLRGMDVQYSHGRTSAQRGRIVIMTLFVQLASALIAFCERSG